jgi:hypothetical protein
VTVRSEWMDDDERPSMRPVCQADFLAQDQSRPGVQERWCARVGRWPFPLAGPIFRRVEIVKVLLFSVLSVAMIE